MLPGFEEKFREVAHRTDASQNSFTSYHYFAARYDFETLIKLITLK